MECEDFFKIKINNNWVNLNEYYEYCDKNKLNYDEEFLKTKIKYFDKEYTFEEYNQDLKNFSQKFIPDEADKKYFKLRENIGLIDKNLFRTMEFIKQINYNVSAGFYFANESYEKTHDIFIRKKSYSECYLIRSFYFNTAIMWYGTCIAYLAQILCSRFNLYKEFTENDVDKMKFDEIVKLCRIEKINEYGSKHTKNEELNRWRKNLNQCSTKCEILNKYYNTIKHRGNFDLKYCNRYSRNVISIKIPQKNFDSNNQFEVIYEDIDKDMNMIVEAHNSIVKCYNYFLQKTNSELDRLIQIFNEENDSIKIYI